MRFSLQACCSSAKRRSVVSQQSRALSVAVKLDAVVSWLYQHMITEKLQHAEDYFPGDDSIGCRSKEPLCCMLFYQTCSVSVLQSSCILNFSLYDSTSPPYPCSYLISRLFSLMPLKAAPLRLVSLSTETLPNQMYPRTPGSSLRSGAPDQVFTGKWHNKRRMWSTLCAL